MRLLRALCFIERRIMFILRHLLLVTLFLSASAFSNPGSWTPYQKIASLIVENGMGIIVVEGGVPNNYVPPECNQQYNQVDLATDHGRAIYSMALAARLAGQPISMALGCFNGRPLINLMRL